MMTMTTTTVIIGVLLIFWLKGAVSMGPWSLGLNYSGSGPKSCIPVGFTDFHTFMMD